MTSDELIPSWLFFIRHSSFEARPGAEVKRSSISMKTLLLTMLAGRMIFGYPAMPQAPDCSQIIRALERNVAAQKRLLNDWAGLNRYGSKNTEIPPPAPGEERVVFLGDQITELWGRAGA